MPCKDLIQLCRRTILPLVCDEGAHPGAWNTRSIFPPQLAHIRASFAAGSFHRQSTHLVPQLVPQFKQRSQSQLVFIKYARATKPKTECPIILGGNAIGVLISQVAYNFWAFRKDGVGRWWDRNKGMQASVSCDKKNQNSFPITPNYTLLLLMLGLQLNSNYSDKCLLGFQRIQIITLFMSRVVYIQPPFP